MNEQIRDQIKTTLNSAGNLLTRSLLELVKHLRSVLPQLNRYTDQELEEMIQISMNYEEEKVATFSLSDAIGWIKENFDKTRYGGGCILRGKARVLTYDNSRYGFESYPEEEASLDSSPGRNTYPITIQLCFLDKHGEPLLKPDCKHKVVHCKAIAQDLERQFGTNDMIILR